MSAFTPGTRFVAPLLFVVVVSACGGGSGDAGITNPPPPPPPALVVTTVEVTPPTPSITADETVQLTAIVKDQNGTAMSGRVVAWSSANVSIATVAASGLVTGIAQGQTTILASVDGKQGSAQLTVATRPRITLDATTAKVASVGPAGGSLTTTSTAGITYVLEIPERALETPVSISITPLSEFRQLPYSGGAVGAVELAPAGLRFARPAILHIKTLPNVGAGLKLVAMYYDGDGARVVPGPAARGIGDDSPDRYRVACVVLDVGGPGGGGAVRVGRRIDGWRNRRRRRAGNPTGPVEYALAAHVVCGAVGARAAGGAQHAAGSGCDRRRDAHLVSEHCAIDSRGEYRPDAPRRVDRVHVLGR